LGILNSANDPISTSPATILDGHGCLPLSESPSNPTGIGPTEDDASLIWLDSQCTQAVGKVEENQSSKSRREICFPPVLFLGTELQVRKKSPGSNCFKPRLGVCSCSFDFAQ
jgi:hypothetical protein